MSLRHRPTAKDVAALAGVSVATVSYVLNGRGARFGAPTRERVLAAVETLGYVPNSSARGLRRRRTDQVCLVVGSTGVPANDLLAQQLHEAADAAGYGVLMLLVDSDERARRAYDALQRHIADGAVIADPFRTLDQARLAELARNNLSLVVMDNVAEPDGFDVVRLGERPAVAEALDHLVASGRRRIAFVGHDSDLKLTDSAPTLRYDAYREALERHGLPHESGIVVNGANDRTLSYWRVTGLLQRDERPDAIFCASDRAAISAVWAIRDAGLSVPHDVAVLGAGNLQEGLITRPALSTVGPPELDFGVIPRMLFERLASQEPPPGREVVLPWTYIRRGTT